MEKGKNLIKGRIELAIKCINEDPGNINMISMWNSDLEGFMTALLYTDSISITDYTFYSNIIRKLYSKKLDLA